MTQKTYQPDERAGIWIDHKVAYFIKISADHSPVVEKLDTELKKWESTPEEETAHLHITHPSPYNRDKQQQHQHYELQAFFRQVINHLRQVDYVYLFGPGPAKHELSNAIEKEGLHFPCKIVGIEPADKMTPKQMQQKVREYFTSLKYEDTIRRLSMESK